MQHIQRLLQWLNRYKQHFLIWFLIYLVIDQNNPLEGNSFWKDMLSVVITLGYAFIVYTLAYWVWPTMYKKQYLKSLPRFFLIGFL